MKSYTFSQMTKQELEGLFGLKRIKASQHPILQEWIANTEALSEEEHSFLDRLKESLIDRIEDWNEQELILKFIGPVMNLVHFDTDDFAVFANRPLSTIIDEVELSGVVDAMVASGWQTPKEPYFCLHEYKKEQGQENDPGGQALAAMLAAQHSNENVFPVYGAYVLGRNWFFMALQDKEYSISNAYTATRDEIYDILKILKHLKSKIYQQVKNTSLQNKK